MQRMASLSRADETQRALESPIQISIRGFNAKLSTGEHCRTHESHRIEDTICHSTGELLRGHTALSPRSLRPAEAIGEGRRGVKLLSRAYRS
eukprot:5311222-Pleurochrysis_carterae.AAC.3